MQLDYLIMPTRGGWIKLHKLLSSLDFECLAQQFLHFIRNEIHFVFEIKMTPSSLKDQWGQTFKTLSTESWSQT